MVEPIPVMSPECSRFPSRHDPHAHALHVVDNAALRDAQKHPDNYRGLVVRVSGYSAYFTDLGKSIQDEIIARTIIGG